MKKRIMFRVALVLIASAILTETAKVRSSEQRINALANRLGDLEVTVQGLPNWVFGSTKCATVTSLPWDDTLTHCIQKEADIIQALKNAGHMAS
jgi:hypothetical protein